MATWTITPKKGTTAEWEESGRILEVNEWGVEVTAKGTYTLRIGDGKNKFLDLPVVVDVGRMEEIATTVANFAANMQQSSAAASQAATAANNAAAAAQAGAKACEKIQAGINSMSDSETGKTYQMGVSGGKIYLEEV